MVCAPIYIYYHKDLVHVAWRHYTVECWAEQRQVCHKRKSPPPREVPEKEARDKQWGKWILLVHSYNSYKHIYAESLCIYSDYGMSFSLWHMKTQKRKCDMLLYSCINNEGVCRHGRATFSCNKHLFILMYFLKMISPAAGSEQQLTRW